jgi:hypothetical protein
MVPQLPILGLGRALRRTPAASQSRKIRSPRFLRLPSCTPQGLKPSSIWCFCGTAEAVPFQSIFQARYDKGPAGNGWPFCLCLMIFG